MRTGVLPNLLGENEKKKGKKLEFELPGMLSCIAPDTHEEDCCQDEDGYCKDEFLLYRVHCVQAGQEGVRVTQGLSCASLCMMWLAASWKSTWLRTCSLGMCSRGAGLSVHLLRRSISDPIHMVVIGRARL